MDTITPEQMKLIEENCERLGVSLLLLMENAGRSLADYLKTRFEDLKGKTIVVVAGTGNNGGDGFAAARHLTRYVPEIVVILLGKKEDIKTSEALTNWQILEKMITSIKLTAVTDPESLHVVSDTILEADVVLDGIFGTGIKGKIREPHASAIGLINESKGFKVAIDIPSGLDPLDGTVHDKAVKADVTITMHRAKSGLSERSEYTGEIVVVAIGVPPEAELERAPH